MRMLPSISSTPLHMQSRLRIVLNSWRSFPNMILRRFFGTQAVWYLHSHTVCDKLLSTAPFVRINRGCSPALSYDKELF